MTSETCPNDGNTQLHSDASKPPALSQRSGSSPPSAASLSTRKDYAKGQMPPRVSPCLRTACSSDAPTPTVAQLAAYQPPRARYLPPPRACRPGQPPWCSSFLRAALGGRRAAPVEPRRGALRCSSLNRSAPLPHLSLPTNSPRSVIAQTRKGTGSNPISDFGGDPDEARSLGGKRGEVRPLRRKAKKNETKPRQGGNAAPTG